MEGTSFWRFVTSFFKDELGVRVWQGVGGLAAIRKMREETNRKKYRSRQGRIMKKGLIDFEADWS